MSTRGWAGLCWCWALASSAQEGPFLSTFTLTDEENGVRLDWTMVAGSTCMGTDIQRSKDSLDFQVVGSIEGLCGSIDGPVDYTFTDTSVPGFGPWYYRLALGLNGSSPVRRVEHLLSSDHDIRVFPNPTEDAVTIVLQAKDQDEVTIGLSDIHGRAVSQHAAAGNVHLYPVGNLPPGTYVVLARWPGRTATTRIIVR